MKTDWRMLRRGASAGVLVVGAAVWPSQHGLAVSMAWRSDLSPFTRWQHRSLRSGRVAEVTLPPSCASAVTSANVAWTATPPRSPGSSSCSPPSLE